MRNLDNLQWKIERVDGVPIEGTLPARQVWVGGGGGGSGSITFAAVVPSGRGFDFHAWLPGFAELAESDDQISTLLRLPKALEDRVERVGH
jgi:hypothetical protein